MLLGKDGDVREGAVSMKFDPRAIYYQQKVKFFHALLNLDEPV